MIRVEVANTFLVNMGKEYVVLLRGADDERTLPISIGQLEAQSIAIELNKIPFPRPLTHDLFKNVLREMDCSLVRAEICNLSEETFFARLIFEQKGRKIEMDSRPSDAIALALRFTAPIFVDEGVMNDSGVIIPEESSNKDDSPANSPQPVAQEDELDLSPVEILKRQLKRAINEERYEDAAHLKQKLDNLTPSGS